MKFLGNLIIFGTIAGYFLATIGFIMGVSQSITFSRTDGKLGTTSPSGSPSPLPLGKTSGSDTPPPKPATDSQAPRRAEDAPPQNSIVWISVDGLRHDYIARAETPTFDRCMETAAWSTKMIPAFPSITFPSHATHATGVPAGNHGVTGNSFYDSVDKETYKFPSAPSLLLSEPIWTTATRQGIRVCSYDWPFSQGQSGDQQSAYYSSRFDASLKAPERFALLANTWRDDRGEKPLQLLMSYAAGVDKAGHRYGPDAPETSAAVTEVDAALGTLVDRATRHFDEIRREGDELYLIVTTDHGMANIKRYASLKAIFGIELSEKIEIAKSGNVACIFVKPEFESTREEVLLRLEAKLEAVGHNTSYRRENLPTEWAFAHPTRTGDLVAVFELGTTINETSKRPISTISTSASLLGMHGYPPETTPEMWGFSLFWRYPTPLEKPGELGKIRTLQLHPTVCKLLSVSPAPNATAAPIDIR